MQEYRDAAGVDEGMDGISTRFAFKVLSATFNHAYARRSAADPVHLMYVLEQAIKREQFPKETEKPPTSLFIKSELAHAVCRVHRQRDPEGLSGKLRRLRPEPVRPLPVDYADAWIEDQDFKDPDTGQTDEPRAPQCQELTKIEKPAGIANPKDFRNEVVKFALRSRAANGGRNPSWTILREDPRRDREADVLPGRGPAAGDQLRLQEGRPRPRRSTTSSSSAWWSRGYTERQVRRLVEWYMRVKQSA